MTGEIVLTTVKLFREKIDSLTGVDLQAFSLQASTKQQISDIYLRVFRKRPKGCDSCWMDAMIQIASLDTVKLMKILECEFAMQAGIVIYDCKAKEPDSAKIMSHQNVTNELAIYHLAMNPGIEKYFYRLPEDWQERVDRKRLELNGPPQKPKEPEKVSPPIDAEIDEVKEKMILDPETLDNSISIEKNPLKETPKADPPAKIPDKPKRKYTKRK